MIETGSFELSGKLVGHTNLITKIATSEGKPNVILSSSRDRTLLAWKIKTEPCEVTGKLLREYKGHNHFVSDVTLSIDGNYAISSSWDKSLCLWDVETAKRSKRFIGHTEEIYALSMSADNRQIVSASADNTVMLWNTIAHCKYVFKDDGHKNTVSSVSLSPCVDLPLMVSGSYDKTVKAWKMNQPGIVANMETDSGVVCTTFSPDSKFIASGTLQGHLHIWYLDKFCLLLDQSFGKEIKAVAFKPDSNILAVASGYNIYLLNVSGLISRKSEKIVSGCPIIQTLQIEEASSERGNEKFIFRDITAITWSPNGEMLYAAYNDFSIRVWIWKKYADSEQSPSETFEE